MFTLIGAAEKAGSGVDKIRRGWNSQQWRSPIVREWMQPDRVLWILPMISLIPPESIARLKNRIGTKFQKLTPLEVQALVTADLESFVDNARMRQITSEHPTDITRTSSKTCWHGYFTTRRSGPWDKLSALSIFYTGLSTYED